MDKKEGSGSPGWTAPYFTRATDDVVRAVAAAASAATVGSSRPSVVFSSKDDDNNGQLQKLQRHVVRVLKGFSPQPEVKIRAYNPEILTSQKRQWARFQLQSLDQRLVREPSRIFESLVVVGLHPNSDVQTLQKQLLNRNTKGLRASRSAINFEQHDRSAISLEPQVLFVYPPEKQLPLKYKDLVSLCFPGGQEVHIVEKTPSMSELNEILLGQEHLKQSNLSFVFRLQVADDSTLYGCCVLVEEIVQKPSGLISMLLEDKPAFTNLSRHILTAPRCYCILSRLPFFDLHFGILKSIFVEEHLQRLTEGIDFLSLMTHKEFPTEPDADTISDRVKTQGGATEGLISGHLEHSKASAAAGVMNCKRCSCNSQIPDANPYQGDGDSSTKFQDCYEIEDHIVNPCQGDDGNNTQFQDSCAIESRPGNSSVVSEVTKVPDKITHEVVLPLLRFHRRDSSESSTSFQGSPCADLNFRSAMEEELEEPSSSGHDESSNHNDILSWAKANNHGSLQIICEYYQLQLPSRGSTLNFHPLEHLHPLKYHRHEETQLQISGPTIHPRSSSTSLELPEVRNALLVEEEAASLSVWTVACICGNLRLESVLLMFAGALLEKQIVVVCSNLGILSATVLSIIPLIRPYQWQSLLMPVLPNDMLDFLDAPVPYIVGIKDITAELQLKLVNNILVNVNKNQVISPLLPQLPNQKKLISSLSPYHATLVGESYLARKRPVYECTDTQVEAAKGFLAVLRSYLDSLCSNLRSHTITNVQSNDDKVSLLLKESFIDSFANRDRPFMRLFVDTQLFSVHTDLILSFYQKD